MKYSPLLLILILSGCVDIPEDYTVIHEIEAPIIDQCKDHLGFQDLDIIENKLVCNDGAEFRIYKGEL